MVSKEQRRRQLAREKLARQQAKRDADARRRRLGAMIAAGVAVLLVIGGITYLALSGNESEPVAAETTTTASPSATKTGGSGGKNKCKYVADEDASDVTVTPPPDGRPADLTGSTATIAFSDGSADLGSVEIALDAETAPCTVQSFVNLAEQGFFDATTCHRLTTSDSLSVLQCGDPTGTGTGGPGYSFADETNDDMTYERGVVAMANSGPDTNGSQFFLVYGDSQLSPDYTVFGHITSGLEVLDTIGAAGVAGGGTDGAPAIPATITTVTISEAGATSTPAETTGETTGTTAPTSDPATTEPATTDPTATPTGTTP